MCVWRHDGGAAAGDYGRQDGRWRRCGGSDPPGHRAAGERERTHRSDCGGDGEEEEEEEHAAVFVVLSLPLNPHRS